MNSNKIKLSTYGMRMNNSIIKYMGVVLIVVLGAIKANAQGVVIGNPKCLPGFTDELVNDGWTELRQITFDSLGRMYVVEAQGKVFIVDTNHVKQIDPLIDISEEVGWWNAHGLLGMALDKDYLTNGYFYLFYTVDRHHLLNYGTPLYNPNVNDYHTATISRVTRFKADSSTNFTTILPGSRFVLLGADKKSGIPVTYNNHDGGGIEMSPDGSLIITTGDSGHGGAVDTGSNSQTYYMQALLDSIILPEENVGAYRSQLKQSLAGKAIRVDPMTGLGLPSNPFYDPAHPESNESKVWALGLRNAFRFAIRPGTSAINNMAAGQPGALFISSVGFHTWEDLVIASTGGKNFGWPIYEGMFLHPFYSTQTIENKFALNPLFGTGSCTNQYFKFTDLLINETLNPTPSWPNPCDSLFQIPLAYTFMRSRPRLSYNHTTLTSYVPGFAGNDPVEFHVGAPGSPASGPEVLGKCIAGAAFYSGKAYPVQYHDRLFYVDFADYYMAALTLDANNQITALDTFATQLGNCISIIYNQKDECLYYIEYPYEIHRIRYTFGLNTAPKAIASQNIYYGPGPLAVSFNGLQSTDPENAALTYFWDFGDGSTSTLAAPQHVFNPVTSNPIAYNITLTVTDTGGLTGVANLIVSVNNTPPEVQITSPIDGSYYSEVVSQLYNLTANVTDSEHGPNELHYEWFTALHHNFHIHPNPIDTNKITYLITDPEDCQNSYSFEITLTVTDNAGLSTQQTVFIYQNCPLMADFTSDINSVCRGDSVHFYENIVGHADSVKWIFQNGSPATSKLFNPAVAYKTGYGYRDVTLIAFNPLGIDTFFSDNYIFIKNSPAISQNITGTIVSCIDDSVLLSVVDSSIYAYQWRKDGVSLVVDTLSSYLAKTTGIYNVKVILRVNGCSKLSEPLNYVEHNISSSLTLSGSNILCTIDSVLLTADYDPSYSYQWHKDGLPINGATSNSYSANATGAYFTSINDTNTCAAISNTENIIKNPESEIAYNGDSVICPAGDVVLLDANLGIGLTYQWYFNGILISGATNPSYTATNEGSYSALVSDAAGCSHFSNLLAVTSCLSLSGHNSEKGLNIYPNPVTNILNIYFESAGNTSVRVKIADALGKIASVTTFETIRGVNNFELSTSQLPQGVYELIIDSDTLHSTMRFVKN